MPDEKAAFPEAGHVTAEDIIQALHLVPLEGEGGMVAETYASDEFCGSRRCGSAIYYLLSGEAFSHLHKLSADEIWHFYYGDPVELVQIRDCDGVKTSSVLGADVMCGQRPQVVVEKGSWQGARLVPGGEHGFALMGTTMTPAYSQDDFVCANRDELLARFPEHETDILKLTGALVYR